MPIRLTSYLHKNRYGIYGFRIVVPKLLRLSSIQKECRLSLSTSNYADAKHLALQLSCFTQNYIKRTRRMSQSNEFENTFDFLQDLKCARDRFTSELLQVTEASVAHEEAVENVQRRIATLKQARDFIDAVEAVGDLNDTEHENYLAVLAAYEEETADIFCELQRLLASEADLSSTAHNLRNSGIQISLSGQHQNAIEAKESEHRANQDKLAEFATTMIAKATAKAVGEVLEARADQPTTEAQSQSLSAIVEAYVANQRAESAWTEKTEAENRAIYALWLRVVGDQPIAGYGKVQHREYKAKLQRLPSNLNKSPKYRDKHIDEILALGDTPAAPNTINKNLTRVSAFFEYAVAHGYATTNPASGMGVKNTKRANEERQAFSDDDLAKLFGSSIYLNGEQKHPYQYWVPLIALYSGARLNEICQLHLNDIAEQDGIQVFRITEEGGNKRLKTKAARRTIPIHSELVRLGLLKYTDALRQQGHDRLFPELKEGRDGYGRVVSKWFAAYATRCGVDAPGKVFHSFRHTFIDRLKQADAPKEKIAALVGHEDESVTFGRYGKDFKPQNLRDVVLLIPNDATTHMKQN